MDQSRHQNRASPTTKRGPGAPFHSRTFQQVHDHPAVSGLPDWGTVHLIAIKNQVGDLPARNHQLSQVPWADQIDAAAFARYTLKNKGCFACPIRCSRVTHVESGPHVGDLEGLSTRRRTPWGRCAGLMILRPSSTPSGSATT